MLCELQMGRRMHRHVAGREVEQDEIHRQSGADVPAIPAVARQKSGGDIYIRTEAGDKKMKRVDLVLAFESYFIDFLCSSCNYPDD